MGYFTCSMGKLVGEPSCSSNDESRRTEVVTKIASTMEVKLDVPASTSIETVRQFFQKSIADALDISDGRVTKLEVHEIGRNDPGRRLRSIRTVRYEVSYEITPASSEDMVVDALLKLVTAMTTQSTTTSQLFWRSLSAKVTKVHEVLLTLPARAFEDEIPIVGQVPQSSAESSGTTVGVTTTVLTCVAILCAVSVAALCLRNLFVLRKRFSES